MATTENHVVKFSPSNWTELRRVAKNHRRTESEVVDDLLAMSGDLDALYDAKGEPQPFTPAVGNYIPQDAKAAAPVVDAISTRAAVLEPSPAELDDLLGIIDDSVSDEDLI